MAPFPARAAAAEDALPHLAPPPRRVPLSLRVRLLFGGLGFFGWLWIAITLAMTAPFLRNTDFTSWRAFRGHLETSPGTVLGCARTGASVGGGRGRSGTPVSANRYQFSWNGVEHRGVSYATGECLAEGDEVVIEHVPGHPERSRIAGMRPSEFDAGASFVLLFPFVGLAMALGAMWYGARQLRLLANGRLALGTLLSKEATNTKVNNRTVMKLRFALVTDRGSQHEVVVRSSMPEAMEDDARERFFYDPARPERAVAWDALPARPELDATGNLRPSRTAPTVAALVPPLLAGAVLAAVIWL